MSWNHCRGRGCSETTGRKLRPPQKTHDLVPAQRTTEAVVRFLFFSTFCLLAATYLWSDPGGAPQCTSHQLTALKAPHYGIQTSNPARHLKLHTSSVPLQWQTSTSWQTILLNGFNSLQKKKYSAIKEKRSWTFYYNLSNVPSRETLTQSPHLKPGNSWLAFSPFAPGKYGKTYQEP